MPAFPACLLCLPLAVSGCLAPTHSKAPLTSLPQGAAVLALTVALLEQLCHLLGLAAPQLQLAALLLVVALLLVDLVCDVDLNLADDGHLLKGAGEAAQGQQGQMGRQRGISEVSNT